eukprot:8344481-Pyramimonas_sp.AAC.1
MAGGWRDASVWKCTHCGCGKTPFSEHWCKRCERHWKTGKNKKPKGKGRDLGTPPGLDGCAPLHGPPIQPGLVQASSDPVPELTVPELQQL